jgi:hypothetical protein
VTSANDNDILDFFPVNAVHNFWEIFAPQHFFREHDSFLSTYHRGKPLIEVWVQPLLASMRKYNSFAPELHLSCACINYLEGTRASPANSIG